MKPYEPFKFATEAGINLYLHQYQLCEQEDFDFLKGNEWLPFYNIYFICQRSRIEVQPDSMVADDISISLNFDVYEGKSSFVVPAKINNFYKNKNIILESDYPNKYFVLVNDKDEASLVKSSHVLDIARPSVTNPEFLDLEVLYVGQTKRTSEAPIVERLVSHSTLQEIYSRKRPDKDIYILLSYFVADGMIESRGSVRVQEEHEEEDLQRLLEFMKNRVAIPKEQQTNLVEACLIKYFEPVYNTIYKNSFPSEKHSNYAECYKLDLNAVSVEINLEENQLYSKKVPSSAHHFERFSLISDSERRNLFDFSVGFDNPFSHE